MKLTEKQLLERDAKRDIAKEILEGVRAIKAGKGRRFIVTLSPVAAARHKARMSQSEFARLLGISVRTLQDWEQGRRQPTGAAKSLLLVAIKHPAMLRQVLKELPKAA
jgi:putative transcriptional regulator